MDFKEALTFRHACKVFDEYKIIEESDFIDILNAGVLAPSSMGLEPWEFEVVRDAHCASKSARLAGIKSKSQVLANL